MKKILILVISIVILILIGSGLSNTGIEVEGNRFYKQRLFFGIEFDKKPIYDIGLPEGFELQTSYPPQISPTGHYAAFAANRSRLAGTGEDGEEFTDNKLYLLNQEGKVTLLSENDNYTNDNNIGKPEQTWEVKSWVDNSTILVDKQSARYIDKSLGELIIDIYGNVIKETSVE